MITKKKTGILLSLFLSMVILLSTFTSFVSAENDLSKIEITTAKEELREASLEKIDSKVLDILDSEDYIEVLVYMQDQVDTEMVAKATRNAVSTAMTPYMTKLEVRKGVVEALQDKAEKTQVNLLNYIEQEKENGKVLEYKPYYIVNMVYVKASKEVIENISYMKEVEKIYKNNFIKLDIPRKTDVEPTVEGLEWNIERVGADLVWNMGIDGTGAVVGLIDTGATWDHEALKEKWRGYDPATGTTNPEGNWLDTISGRSMPYDIPSAPHGSHVLGTILGQDPQGLNKIGVAPGAKWIAAKAFSEDGGYDNDLITAGEWMLAPGGDPTKAPDVINNSWGGGAVIDDWFRGVVNAWRAAEIVPVFAAGNQKYGEPSPWPGSIENPGNYPESFAVAAIDKNNIRASFSKLGPSLYDDSIIKPEISAPGVGIRSSVPGGYEGGWSGTSMATPHIVGTTALLVSANNSLTVEEIEEIIENTATPLTDGTYPDSPNFGYGYGLVNAFDAVSATAAGRGTIKGKVLAEGEDLEEPVIVHEQEITETYVGSDILITANISDDISIVEAELLVKIEGNSYWALVPMNRIAGDHKDGVYSGTISYDMLSGDSIVYKIRARDFDGNAVVTEDYNIDIKFGIVPGEYKQGFENNPMGWIFDEAWDWGIPSGPSPTPFEGEQLAGTVLDGNYPSNADSWLITPPIDLRDETMESATLRFYEWYETENNWDKGYVLITDDYGENWTQIDSVRTGNGMEWKESVINLMDYVGYEEPVFVAFRLTSDSGVNKTGWYIDNVRIMGVDEEPPAIPTGLTTEKGIKGIKLTWEKVIDGDLSHYNVYRSLTSEEGFEMIAETVNNSFTDSTGDANETYYYKIAAVDFSGNISEYSEEVSETMPEVTIIYNEDFEDDNGNFTTGVTTGSENPWEWGVPISGPNGATSGAKLWATNLSGSYNKNTNAYIESPTITLPEDKYPVLLFNHWVDMEGTSTLWDYGQLLISNDDGATWTNITSATGGKYGRRVQSWAEEQILLTEYMGQDIKLRFFFHSDVSGQYNGWYIDDINIVGLNELPLPDSEIAYDDGTAEDALVLVNPDNGLAVKFTPAQYGKVNGANVYIWGNDWPEPGGNRLGFVIYDGAGTQIGEPIYVDNLVRGDWNYIDLSSLNFCTAGDFYISTLQDQIGDLTPGTGLDDNTSSDHTKSYINIGGVLTPLSEEGISDTVMIRANMDYSVTPTGTMESEITKLDIENNKSDANIEDMIRLWSNEGVDKKSEYKDPKAPQFSLIKDKINNYETIDDNEVEAKLNSIPVEAVVTVLETGKSVRTNPATGDYEIKHAANEEDQMWTLRAEAYGYYPQEVQVYLGDEAVVSQNFRLEAIPQGSIVGRVFDRYSKDPAANAVIRIKEDPRVAPVFADEDGYFTIPNVYEGEYTLKITADGFESGEAEITVLPNQENDIQIGLKRFVGYEEEIIYDDGTGENALVLNGANNGLAVRFTPEQFGKVVGANIYFWDSSWPAPGGNEIGIAIFDTDANGNPTKMIGSPKIVDVTRGEWNLIDLSEFGFATDRDFFIATMQTADGSNSPGTGIDESCTVPERSYLHIGGEEFTPLADEDVSGGLMIRAMVKNSVSTPLITNLSDINYTNQDSITVEGKVEADGKVNIYVNDNEAITVNTENLEFTAEIELDDVETTIMVSAEMDGIETEPSTPITVIKDKVAPILEVTKPLDEEKVNVELVHVVGNVFDDYLDKLLINGEEVEVDEEGNFHERVIVFEGENIITISTNDLAGNLTTVERIVYVKLEGSEIENIEPIEDITLEAGDTLTVRFNGETGGEGHFRVLPNISVSSVDNSWIPVVEVEDTPGLYEGTWTIPEGFVVTNGLIEIEFIDTAGNIVSAVAPGMVTVLPDEEPEPEPEPEIPVLTNIEPATDKTLTAGETLEVSFNAPENGIASFLLRLPLGLTATDNGISMVEETPGFYRGTWTVPEELLVENLRIEIVYESEDGIVVSATATGRVDVVEPAPETYTVSFELMDGEELVEDATIVVKNGQQIIEKEEDGTYKLIAGTYSYTVVSEGYEEVTGTFEVIDKDIVVSVSLVKLPVGEPMENLPTSTVIVNNEAYDIRFLNDNSEAQEKLIEWYSGKNPIYIKLNVNTIVNISGEEVGLEVLPDELIYYDANGDVTVYSK